MNKGLIAVCIKNMVVMLCFTALAIVFEKWWIVLFCAFFITSYEKRHTRRTKMDKLIQEIHKILLENKVTIRATSGADLLITDEETGEERVLKDLGYPF